MPGDTFSADMSKAARLADANSHSGLVVRVRLDPHGFLVRGAAPSAVRPVNREYSQLVSYREAELSDGFALYEAIKKVVVGLGREFVDLDPPAALIQKSST